MTAHTIAEGSSCRDHHTTHQQIIVICICLVELACSELWVVCQVNAFIAELTTDLIHTLQTTNYKHLQVQLRGNTHVQLQGVYKQYVLSIASCQPPDHESAEAIHIHYETQNMQGAAPRPGEDIGTGTGHQTNAPNQLLPGNEHSNIYLHVQVIMVCHEWPCCCSTRDHVHHGCLNLQEVAVIKESPHKLNNPAAGLEYAPDIVIAHQVQVALAVAGLL